MAKFEKVTAFILNGMMIDSDWRPEHLKEDSMYFEEIVINTDKILRAAEFERMGCDNTMVYTQIDFDNGETIFVCGGFTEKLCNE